MAGIVAATLGAAVFSSSPTYPASWTTTATAPDRRRRGLERLVRDRVVDGGTLPKVDAALGALDAGAARVRIVDGRRPHAVILALLAGEGFGTEIVR